MEISTSIYNSKTSGLTHSADEDHVNWLEASEQQLDSSQPRNSLAHNASRLFLFFFFTCLIQMKQMKVQCEYC